MASLTRIVPYAQNLLAEVLSPGDLAVDLTAGNGNDTLFLHRQVTASGQVVAFDITAAALDTTAARLERNGASLRRISQPHEPLATRGVTLVAAGHEHCGDYLATPVQAAIANLGYLPGSDRRTPTRSDTSLAALERIAAQLAPGGRLAVVAYPGHAEGESETAAVEDWFQRLPRASWSVLQISVGNCPQAPRLLVAEKNRSR